MDKFCCCCWGMRGCELDGWKSEASTIRLGNSLDCAMYEEFEGDRERLKKLFIQLIGFVGKTCRRTGPKCRTNVKCYIKILVTSFVATKNTI